jgi:nitroreductase
MHIVTGAALTRIKTKLTAMAQSGAVPVTKPLPEPFRHYRSELGHVVYGPDGYGISREDTEARLAASRRNYRFFDAPLGAFVCMHEELTQADALSVGMWLQTFCLALSERGIATCVAVSVVGYPEVVREELGLGEEALLLTGLAVGYEDEEKKVNKVHTERDAWKACVRFYDE